MPKAQVSDEAVRCGLKSVPDGFVLLRKMNYGMRLKRAEATAGMSAELNQDRGGAPKELKFDMGIEAGALFDFNHCILDHNLEKENGSKFNLSNPDDLMLLDPAVGEEIAELIEKMNGGEDMSPFTFSPQSTSSTTDLPQDGSKSVSTPQGSA